jgi:hypothetical protein
MHVRSLWANYALQRTARGTCEVAPTTLGQGESLLQLGVRHDINKSSAR